MLYYLFDYLDKVVDLPGAGVFKYISFRASAALILSLFITLVAGGKIINFLRKKQIGETIRELGLQGQAEKKGTPTMGGIIIMNSILVSSLLFNKLDNIYVILMIITTVWLGLLGFVDDYIKVFKKNKEGLSGRYKLLGQAALGLVVGLTVCYHPDIVIVDSQKAAAAVEQISDANSGDEAALLVGDASLATSQIKAEKSLKTTIPFFKNNELDYGAIFKHSWVVFVLLVLFVVMAVSNGANLTDGMDGLLAGTSTIIGSCLALLAWISGNAIFADYLDIMFIPNVGELSIFIAAFVGAMIGFFWYNTYPAQVFMGDTGSLMVGGIIAVFAILIRKELLLPLICGIFLVESLSVMLQVSYFKYTKKRFGEGKRIFKMSPLHHHYQVKGFAEPKIVIRFLIIGLLLAVVSVATLKLR